MFPKTGSFGTQLTSASFKHCRGVKHSLFCGFDSAKASSLTGNHLHLISRGSTGRTKCKYREANRGILQTLQKSPCCLQNEETQLSAFQVKEQ